MAANRVVIKKYENRRLYDSTNSRYVNLDEVAEMLRRGKDVQVIDAATGEDITRLILTQIIVEGAKAPDSNFPLDILRQMVVASGRASQESALRYTKAMLDLYQSTYRAMAPALNPFEFMQNAGGPASPAAGEPPSQPEPRSGRGNGRDLDEVNRLKERVAELEKLVSSLASAGSSRKKAPRKPGNRKNSIG